MDQTSPNARRASAYLKTALLSLVFVLAYSPLIFFRALTAPVMLDENESLRRLKKPVGVIEGGDDYFVAIDHPAMFRWIDRVVLRAAGVDIGDVPRIDASKDYDWNIAHGRAAPRRPVTVLRAAGAAALSGAMLLFFLMAQRIFGGYVWGFLLTAPFVFPPSLGRYVGGYIWTDSYLAFFLALVLYLWVISHLSQGKEGFVWVVAMGVAAGLAVATKLNGALALAAYAAYLALTQRGADRVWRPMVFCLVAFTVFVAANPVLQREGVGGALDAMGAMLARRGRVYGLHEHLFGIMPGWKMFTFMFPYWYLLPPAALLVWANRRERWFAPVILWSLFLVVGTAVTVDQPFIRYLMPIEFGITVSVMFSAIAISRRLYRREMTMRDVFRIW